MRASFFFISPVYIRENGREDTVYMYMYFDIHRITAARFGTRLEFITASSNKLKAEREKDARALFPLSRVYTAKIHYTPPR